MADWVAGVNRLRALLGSIFPALETAFDYSSRTSLILVASICTPTEIRAAGTEGITTHLTDNGAWRPGITKTAVAAVAAADRQTFALPGEEDTAMLVKRVAAKLLDLDREIQDIDKLISARFRKHPWAKIIESLPGMGPGLGAEFVVQTGGELPRFASSGRLASYAGLVPVPRDSGRVSGNLHRPKRYNRRLRRVLYMAALSSLKVTDGPSRRFYDKKRSERLVHTQALLALARRLVDVLWALLRDGREFTFEHRTPLASAA
jgi:transposase